MHYTISHIAVFEVNQNHAKQASIFCHRRAFIVIGLRQCDMLQLISSSCCKFIDLDFVSSLLVCEKKYIPLKCEYVTFYTQTCNSEGLPMSSHHCVECFIFSLC